MCDIIELHCVCGIRSIELHYVCGIRSIDLHGLCVVLEVCVCDIWSFGTNYIIFIINYGHCL